MSIVPIPEPLVFVDLETTGANFANDRIMEIGLVEVDQNGVREWSSLVDPESAIPPFITGLTGIDASMVEGQPTFASLAPALLERLRGKLFVAHNARFDYGFLKREFKRLGLDFRATVLCTVRLSRKLYPAHHRHNLDTLVERHGIDAGDRHRALADARVLWSLWQRWHGELPASAIRDAVDGLILRPELPPQLDPTLLDDLPESPGAYALHGEDDVLLHVGRSTNLRQQILGHFSGGRRDSALARDTRRVARLETAGELGARLHEVRIKREQATGEFFSWQLVPCATGDYRPQLVSSEEVDFGASDDLFGLFANRREATHSLRKLAEAHKLCHSVLGLGQAAVGEACIAYRQRTCRGVCVGKEAISVHSARLMTALARIKLKPWPYPGPVAVIESDEFGTRKNFHVVDRWRHLGMVESESGLSEVLDTHTLPPFDPDAYRVLSKFLATGKLQILTLSR